MSDETVYAAIQARLASDWTATPVAYENDVFRVPAPPSPWLLVEITGLMTEQVSIGAGSRNANRWREDGQLWLHLFVPVSTGSLTARALLRQAVDLFRGTDLGAITFMSAHVGVGESAQPDQRGVRDGMWWRLSAAIDWQRDL
jgi:hypothetical protein